VVAIIHHSVQYGEIVRTTLALLLILSAAPLVAQMPQIRPGDAIFIEPMSGYELDLAAALMKKKVPLTIVRDKSQAAFIVRGQLNAHSIVPVAVVLSTNGLPSSGFPITQKYPNSQTEASITVLDAHNARIVYAYTVNKSADTNQRKSVAEACAKHLKDFMAKIGK
jgi:hypothetical protein